MLDGLIKKKDVRNICLSVFGSCFFFAFIALFITFIFIYSSNQKYSNKQLTIKAYSIDPVDCNDLLSNNNICYSGNLELFDASQYYICSMFIKYSYSQEIITSYLDINYPVNSTIPVYVKGSSCELSLYNSNNVLIPSMVFLGMTGILVMIYKYYETKKEEPLLESFDGSLSKLTKEEIEELDKQLDPKVLPVSPQLPVSNNNNNIDGMTSPTLSDSSIRSIPIR